MTRWPSQSPATLLTAFAQRFSSRMARAMSGNHDSPALRCATRHCVSVACGAWPDAARDLGELRRRDPVCTRKGTSRPWPSTRTCIFFAEWMLCKAAGAHLATMQPWPWLYQAAQIGPTAAPRKPSAQTKPDNAG